MCLLHIRLCGTGICSHFYFAKFEEFWMDGEYCSCLLSNVVYPTSCFTVQFGLFLRIPANTNHNHKATISAYQSLLWYQNGNLNYEYKLYNFACCSWHCIYIAMTSVKVGGFCRVHIIQHTQTLCGWFCYDLAYISLSVVGSRCMCFIYP